MKSFITILLTTLSLCAFVAHSQQSPLNNETSVVSDRFIHTSFEDQDNDSIFAFSKAKRLHDETYARTGKNSLVLDGKVGISYFALSNLIEVTKNQYVSIQAYAAYSSKNNQSNSISTLTKAATIISSQQSVRPNNSDVQNNQNTKRGFPIIGAAIAFSPSMMKQSKNGFKACLQYILYDADTMLIRTGVKYVDMSAKDSWQELAMKTIIPKNGFLQVVFLNEGNGPIYVDDFLVNLITPKTNFLEGGNFEPTGKKYKGSLAESLNLGPDGGCAQICGRISRNVLSSGSGWQYVLICYDTIICNSGTVLSTDGCETVYESTGTGGGVGGGGDGSGGDTGGGDTGNPCPGGAYLDGCGTCVGGNTGLTVQVIYQDNDGDGWGNSAVTKLCAGAGIGWALKSGDHNDNCYNENNELNQCICTNQVFDMSNVYLHEYSGNPRHVLQSLEFGYTDVEALYINIDVCRDGNQWRAVLRNVSGSYSLRARMAPGTAAVNPYTNTNQYNFCDQVRDLRLTSRYCNYWYIVSAIVAHENIHQQHIFPALQSIIPQVKASVEAITVPYLGQSANDAIAQITNTYMANEEANAYSEWDIAYGDLLSIFNDHGLNFNGPAYQAENATVLPIINNICNRFPCGSCPP